MLEQKDDTDDAGSGRQHEKAIGAPGVLIDGIPVQQFFLYRKENRSPERIIQKIATDCPQEDDEREDDISSFQQVLR